LLGSFKAEIQERTCREIYKNKAADICDIRKDRQEKVSSLNAQDTVTPFSKKSEIQRSF